VYVYSGQGLTVSIETTHPAEGVTVKVISGVSHGVEVCSFAERWTCAHIRVL
jgi:hypothetical protein